MTNFKIHLLGGQVIEAENMWPSEVMGHVWAHVVQTDGFEDDLNIRDITKIEKLFKTTEEQK